MIPILLENRIIRHFYPTFTLLFSFLSYFLSLFLHPFKEKTGHPSGFFFLCGVFMGKQKKGGSAALLFLMIRRPYSSSISSSLALTGWPSFTRTDLTVPAVRAVMAVSIFMASMMIST